MDPHGQEPQDVEGIVEPVGEENAEPQAEKPINPNRQRINELHEQIFNLMVEMNPYLAATQEDQENSATAEDEADLSDDEMFNILFKQVELNNLRWQLTQSRMFLIQEALWKAGVDIDLGLRKLFQPPFDMFW